MIRIVITANRDRVDDNGQLYNEALQSRAQLAEQANELVFDFLGTDFRVQEIHVQQGSAIIKIVLSTVGTVFMGFSRYESFVKSVNLLVAQLTTLTSQRFGYRPGRDIAVAGTWEPAPNLFRADRVPDGKSTHQFLLMYLVVSHAALMGLLMWLVLHRGIF